MMDQLGVVVMKDGSRIIVRDSTEVYIPENERKRILETLHIILEWLFIVL